MLSSANNNLSVTFETNHLLLCVMQQSITMSKT